MRYRPLGQSGLMVSVVGLGCNNFGRRIDIDRTRAVVEAALDAGITLFDTADVYGGYKGESEEHLGEVLAGRRHDVVIATKFGNDMAGIYGNDFGARASRRYIRRAIEGSLRRLRTDYVDLYQLHRPDGVTPTEETLSALDELVNEGKVRYLGSSNFAAWQVVEAEWVARSSGTSRFVSAQNYYNLLDTSADADLIPACTKYGIGVLPYFPLANGLLTGKYHRGEPPPAGTRLAAMPDAERRAFRDETWDRLETLEKYAAERGRTLLDIAIGGLAARPAVASVIAGATKPEQVTANAAAGEWEPTTEDRITLEALIGRDGNP